MTTTKASRGRPKGTGLNDAALLQAIAGLMAGDPALKPTTAIKTLGISDPSVIRRLRDKYHLEANKLTSGLPVPATANHRLTPEPLRLVGRDALSAPRSAALASARPAKVSAAVQLHARPRPVLVASAALPETVAPGPALSQATPADPSPAWIDSGIAFLALSVEAHFAVLNSVFQWPPAVAVVRSHIAFTEFALAIAVPFHVQPSRVS